jgi:DNA-binding MarR family transcriptional regulator
MAARFLDDLVPQRKAMPMTESADPSAPSPEVPASAPPEGAAYVLDDQVGFLLRKAQQRHLSIFSAHIGAELTAMQFAALAKLYETGPTSQNALGRLTAMDVATIKGVVSRLSARGLIEKFPSREDRRLHLIDLTEAGRAAVVAALPRARDITARTLAPLEPADQAVLVDLLRRIT